MSSQQAGALILGTFSLFFLFAFVAAYLLPHLRDLLAERRIREEIETRCAEFKLNTMGFEQELTRLLCEQTKLEIDALKRANELTPIHLKPHEPGWHPPTFTLLHSTENQQSTD